MCAKIMAVVLLGLLLPRERLAAALLTYNFGTAGAPTANATFSDPNITAGAFSAFSGGALVTTDGVTPSAFRGERNWNRSVAQISQANYFSFTVSAAAGYQLDLSSLSFAVRSVGGPSSFQVRSSLDNYASSIGGGGVSGTWSSSGAIDLGAAAFQDLSTITFRIYGFGDGNNGNGSYFLIDDVSLDGVAAVPEPVTVALGLFGLGCSLVTAGRRVARNRRS